MPKDRTRAYDPSHALDLDDASKMNQMHEAPLLDLLLRRFRKVSLSRGGITTRKRTLWLRCKSSFERRGHPRQQRSRSQACHPPAIASSTARCPSPVFCPLALGSPQDAIYTNVADVLISVNPYKNIPLLYEVPLQQMQDEPKDEFEDSDGEREVSPDHLDRQHHTTTTTTTTDTDTIINTNSRVETQQKVAPAKRLTGDRW